MGALEKKRKRAEKEAEKKGMEYVGRAPGGDAPDWIRLPDRFKLSGSRGEYTNINGDNFVYRLISDGGGGATVYRQLKSEYYDTTSDKATCPNCQEYVRRFEDDDYLTCPRCGWQYKPLKERFANLFR